MKKLAVSTNVRDDLLTEIEQLQGAVPLFPNDPEAKRQWINYFARPDFGA